MVNLSRFRCRMAAAVVLAATLSVGGAAAGMAPASAATAHHSATHAAVVHVARPFSSQGCNGDVCMLLSSPHNGTVYIQAWAYDQSFYGYFHLSGPKGLSRNSSTKTWIGGKGNYYQWNNISAVVGQYCVTGHSYGKKIGEPCQNIE